MFSSQMNFLFTLLTILLKSRTDVEQKRASKLEAFIVGGKYATIQDFPHSALLAIHCRKKSFEDFTCGASILNQWILLTAAHCFHGCKTDTKILVLVGDRIKMKGTYYSISKFAGHADYQGEQMKNDIAVALASKPLVFSSTVKRVQLSPVGIYNEPALVAGWGVTDEALETDTAYLKWTRQIVWTRKQCSSVLPHLNWGFLCGTPNSSDNNYGYAAAGDSGSALIVRRSVQIGIVSYKVSNKKDVIVYTDVSKYHSWIANSAKKLFCD